MGVSKTSKPAANPLDELFGKKQTPVPTTSSSSAALSTGKYPHVCVCVCVLVTKHRNHTRVSTVTPWGSVLYREVSSFQG